MAQQGRANLTQQELAELYAQFQEWNCRSKIYNVDNHVCVGCAMSNERHCDIDAEEGPGFSFRYSGPP